MAVTILVLQAFTIERRTSCRRTEQETARALIAGRPGQVANTLESEHRVIDVERNHRSAVRGVRSRCGNPRRHCAGFVNAFLQDLTVLVFFIEHQLLRVLRRIQLSDR